jgi:hypothetical protein
MPDSDMSFRAAAEECRRLAAKTIDPVERQKLQRTADEWLRLAQVAGVASDESPAELLDETKPLPQAIGEAAP